MTRLLAAAIFCGALQAAPDLEPGLVGEYFELTTAPSDFPALAEDAKPTYVRVESLIDWRSSRGEFHGTRLSENFYASFRGVLRIAKGGAYTFLTCSDDGSRVWVDGKVVVENGGVHAMTIKKGVVTLAAGDHEFRLDYFQASADLGLQLYWEPPGVGREPIPTSVLFHKKGAEKVEWDKAAWEKRKTTAAPAAAKAPGKKGRGAGKYADMDYGPYMTGTIETGPKAYANKGLVIKLDAKVQAAVCFDTELLKVSSAWTGGFVGFPSGRDGMEGQPFADGEALFGTGAKSPGWARGEEIKDPRPIAYKPLPADWARYKGLYLHGEKVVLRYSVGDADVLDQPGYAAAGDLQVFTRSLSIGKSSRALRMLVCERDGAAETKADRLAVLSAGGRATAVGLLGAPEGVTTMVVGTRIELRIPETALPAKFGVAAWSGPEASLPAFAAHVAKAPAPEDPAAFTKGGPARWKDPVVTQGKLGVETGAYAVDTLTVPFDNPWKSYMRLTGVDFFTDGRAAVATYDGDVWIVSGIDATLQSLRWQRYATGLFQALGLRIVKDVVYTLGRDQITRLHDSNGDGEADFYECFNNEYGATPAYHEFAHDLHTDSQGWFYFVKGSNLGKAVVPEHGAMCRVSPDGQKLEVFSPGYRAPNGMSVGPSDEVTTSDNQGNWVPATPINWIRKGTFGGFLPCAHQAAPPKERPAPLCWIPHSADNSGGGQVWVTSDRWGPFKGDLLHLSYGKCLLFKAFIERRGEEVQGGVFKFPLAFQSGIMRGRFNPVDGQLYVSGLKGWQTNAAREGALQRVRYTGKPANMPRSVKTTPEGFEIAFTDPLDRSTAASVDSWSAKWFNYRWTGDYGSPEYEVTAPDKKGREPLPIKSAELSEDGKTVKLGVPGLRPVHQVVITYRIKAADGTPLSQEIDYTINWTP